MPLLKIGLNGLMTSIPVLAGAGAVIGVLYGLFGVGSAFATPLLALLGVPALAAVASPLPSLLPGSAAGATTYARAGLVDRSVATPDPAGRGAGLRPGCAGQPLVGRALAAGPVRGGPGAGRPSHRRPHEARHRTIDGEPARAAGPGDRPGRAGRLRRRPAVQRRRVPARAPVPAGPGAHPARGHRHQPGGGHRLDRAHRGHPRGVGRHRLGRGHPLHPRSGAGRGAGSPLGSAACPWPGSRPPSACCWWRWAAGSSTARPGFWVWAEGFVRSQVSPTTGPGPGPASGSDSSSAAASGTGISPRAKAAAASLTRS